MNNIIEKIDSLNERAYEQIYKDISLAHQLIIESTPLAVKAKYTRGIAWSLLNSGLIEMERDSLEKSLSTLRKADRIFMDLSSDYKGITTTANSLGLVYIRFGKMREAFSYLRKALELSRKHNFKNLECKTMNYLGILQFRSERYSQALRFFQVAHNLDTSGHKTSLLNNMGCTYRALNKNDRALYFLKKALKQSKIEGRLDAHVAILEEQGLTYGQMNENDQSMTKLQSALDLCGDNNSRLKPSIYLHMGELLLKQQNYDEAEKILASVEVLINDSNSISHRNLYLLLSEIFEHKGDHKKALKNYRIFHNLSEKLKSSELDEELWLMETELLRKINHRIATISEMGKKLTGSLERKEVFQTLVKSLSTLFPIDYCIVGEVSENSARLKTEIFNINSGETHTLDLDLRNPKNIISWVAYHKSGLVLNDIANEYRTYFEEYDRASLDEALSSTLCLPYETTECRGSLGIYAKKKNVFTEEDWKFMEMLTSYAATALNNTKQTERIKAYNSELIKLNKFDNLTEIYNRGYLLQVMEQSWKFNRRNRSFIHIMLLDIDFFKNINDTYGHEAGDYCLKGIGQIFKTVLQRSSDGYGRYGGEEFIIFLQEMNPHEALIMAEKIRKEIENTIITVRENDIHLTVSIGLCSIIPPHDENMNNLQSIIQEADKNMYISKDSGRNRTTSKVL